MNPSDQLQEKLALPKGTLDMVLDTDTYNEIDDQFALVYSAISEKVNLRAVYAAPFHNARSSGPKDGMLKSYDEICRVLSLLKVPYDGLVLRGSTEFMTAEKQPVDSDAAQHLVQLAHETPEGEPLYVVAIGAITNVASALTIDPKIKDRIVVVWLGGHPIGWIDNREFNLKQDPYAVQVVFDSQVPLVHVPCKNVAEHVRSTVPEMRVLLGDKGDIGQYLTEIFVDYIYDGVAGSKEIWDLAAVAWVLSPETVPSIITQTPVLNLDERLSWSSEEGRHIYRVCIDAKRDVILREFVDALDRYLHSETD